MNFIVFFNFQTYSIIVFVSVRKAINVASIDTISLFHNKNNIQSPISFSL